MTVPPESRSTQFQQGAYIFCRAFGCVRSNPHCPHIAPPVAATSPCDLIRLCDNAEPPLFLVSPFQPTRHEPPHALCRRCPRGIVAQPHTHLREFARDELLRETVHDLAHIGPIIVIQQSRQPVADEGGLLFEEFQEPGRVRPIPLKLPLLILI